MVSKRKVWLDTLGQPVITSTPDGEDNARRWGWAPAVAIAQGPINPASLVTTDEETASLQALCDLARRGRADFMDQAEYGDYTDQEIADATLEWESVAKLINSIERTLRQPPPQAQN